jgi:hypothetical protein
MWEVAIMPAPKTIFGWLLACAIGVGIGAVATYLATPYRGLAIQAFSADKQEVLIGEKVTFSWNVTGASRVAFRFVHLPTGSNGDLWEQVYTDVSAGGLSASGQWSYEVPTNLPDTRFKFEIEGADEAGNKIAARSEEFSIKYRPCFDGTDGCATVPVQTKAMFQPFERGYMLWREDTHTIYVIGNAPSGAPHFVEGWRSYEDTWAADQTYMLADTPSTGLLMPQGRFVKILADNPDLLGEVGWATAPETVFEATMQQTRNFCNMFCNMSLLTKLADGRILRLTAGDSVLQEGHVWQFVEAAS